jgi:hypothetical protein
MQVALNGDDEYVGGLLVFATSAGFEKPVRPAGSATIHTAAIPHGVTSLVSGVRYGLFFCDTRQQPMSSNIAATASHTEQFQQHYNQQHHLSCCSVDEVDLGFLVQPVVSQFAKFERTVALLERTTDAELGTHVSEYRMQFSAMDTVKTQASTAEAAEVGGTAAFPLEVIRQVHMLHPKHYRECVRARGEGDTSSTTGAGDEMLSLLLAEAANGGINLVAAVRRQEAFMKGMLAQRLVLESVPVVTAAIAEYRRFISRLRLRCSDGEEAEDPGAGRGLAPPTLLVDLVWHTHQQHPGRYGEDCLRLAGVFVDHDDDVSPELIAAATR